MDKLSANNVKEGIEAQHEEQPARKVDDEDAGQETGSAKKGPLPTEYGGQGTTQSGTIEVLSRSAMGARTSSSSVVMP